MVSVRHPRYRSRKSKIRVRNIALTNRFGDATSRPNAYSITAKNLTFNPTALWHIGGWRRSTDWHPPTSHRSEATGQCNLRMTNSMARSTVPGPEQSSSAASIDGVDGCLSAYMVARAKAPMYRMLHRSPPTRQAQAPLRPPVPWSDWVGDYLGFPG